MKLLFVVVLVVGVAGCGVNPSIDKGDNSARKVYDAMPRGSVGYVVEIEGCEYILMESPDFGGCQIIHKQNCKFCKGAVERQTQ